MKRVRSTRLNLSHQTTITHKYLMKKLDLNNKLHIHTHKIIHVIIYFLIPSISKLPL